MHSAPRRLFHAILATTAIMLALPAVSPGASPGDPHPTFATFDQHVGPATGHESATDVVVQPDGKVLVGIVNDAELDQRIVRLMPDGTLDPSFGTGGVWTVPSANNVVVRAIAVQPDGRIIYAGEDATASSLIVGRLTSTGGTDLTWSSDGEFLITASAGSLPMIEDVFVEPSGKVTFVGVIRNGVKLDDLFMGRLTNVGTDDPDFAGAPLFLFGSPFDGDADKFGGIALMPNGDYVVGNPHSGTASQVWRINTTGGSRVAANVEFPNAFDDPIDVMATDATHAVVLLEGSATTGLAYLDVAATPKISTYAGNAGTIQPFPTTFKGHELLRQSDGRFFVAGTDSTDTIHRAIMRLEPTGMPDTTWAPGGIKHLSGTSTRRFYLDRHSLAFLPDGSLVSAYHAFAGDFRQTVVQAFVARIARIRPEITFPLTKGVVNTPVDVVVRAANDGPDGSGAGKLTFQVSDGLRITQYTGADCTVDARGGSCTFANVAVGATKQVSLKVKAITPGEHTVTASVDAAVIDDDTGNDSLSATHPFEAAPVAAATPPTTTQKPAAKPAATGPKPLQLTLQRITRYDGRVIPGCTVRVMCVVSRVRGTGRIVDAYLRAKASKPGARTLILSMQTKVRNRWVTKQRYKLPMGDNGGLDIKLPTDWRANAGTWRIRLETPARRNVKPTVSTWLMFKVR